MLLSSPSPRAACALLLALLALGLPPPARCSGLTVQLDAFGLHGVRVRVAPSGNGIVQPKHTALLAAAPASTPSVPSSATRVTSGNLMVEADASTGMVTATRLSDNTVVLRQETLRFSAPMAPVLNKKNRGLVVAFEGHGAGERVYGLGEHRTGKVNQMPYQQVNEAGEMEEWWWRSKGWKEKEKGSGDKTFFVCVLSLFRASLFPHSTACWHRAAGGCQEP